MWFEDEKLSLTQYIKIAFAQFEKIVEGFDSEISSINQQYKLYQDCVLLYILLWIIFISFISVYRNI